jgi:hypothetical protein
MRLFFLLPGSRATELYKGSKIKYIGISAELNEIEGRMTEERQETTNL